MAAVMGARASAGSRLISGACHDPPFMVGEKYMPLKGNVAARSMAARANPVRSRCCRPRLVRLKIFINPRFFKLKVELMMVYLTPTD